VSLTDEDRRLLAAVAMGLVWRLPYQDHDQAVLLYLIGNRNVTDGVRRLMAKQLVVYTDGKVQTINRRRTTSLGGIAHGITRTEV
jgi:hypothetical protein